MSETVLQVIASCKFVAIGVYALLYGLGGIDGKWKRRVLGALVYTGAIIGFSLLEGSFNWWYLMCAPILFGSTSIGYGAEDNEVGKKVFKRFYCGLAYSCVGLPLALINEAWVLFILHTVLCIGTSVLLGVLNPTHARNEETLIGTAISLLPIYMI